MKNTINILHLSDLHFGMESSKDTSLVAKRKNALGGIFHTLKELPSDERPHIVIVSGDITWQGKEAGYDEANKWLKTLLNNLELDDTQLVVCAGNHDIQRDETLGMTPPKIAKDADEWLRVEKWTNFVRPFTQYSEFCKSFPIEPLEIGDTSSYLVGTRKINGLNFVVLNSSWFCRDNNDFRKLWLGLPQLQLMVSKGQLFENDDFDKAPITLALVHHPREWFHDEDQHTYDRPAAYKYLAEHAHLILSGHVHAAPEAPSNINGKAFVILGGASYSGDNYRNNFSLVKINTEDRSFTQIPFEYDPRYEDWNRRPEYSFFFQIGKSINTTSLDLKSAILKAPLEVQTAEQHWNDLNTFGDSLPLIQDLFLINRSEACKKLKDVLTGEIKQLQVDSHFTNQVADFVAAYITSSNGDSVIENNRKCLIVSNAEAWNTITTNDLAPHLLVVNFGFESADIGVKLLNKAIKRGHTVVYCGMPGGIPNDERVTLHNPKSQQIQETLAKAGYNEERARKLAQLCDGNLGLLVKSLKQLSLTPDWSHGDAADELMVTGLIGSWSENEADKELIEYLSGIPYETWVKKVRDVSLRPGNPLQANQGNWKVLFRYEVWYALGPRLFDEHLKRLKDAAVTVLTEIDPKFELEDELRHAASIFNKKLKHSNYIRSGIAETLALLGSHPEALSSCTVGVSETTAILAVREIFSDANWLLWASLDSLLPLLAEAAPNEFLDAVEHSLTSSSKPFETIFTQEGKGIMGWNYMSGLLWALETLAWESKYLTQVVVILGELASIDPGGTWANRPANSLSTILLPWFPQTTARIEIKKAAIETLIGEFPEVAWKLLLEIMPQGHQVSSGSHKPSWRRWIPDDWSSRVSIKEYTLSVSVYAELTISFTKTDISKLTVLIERLADFPSNIQNVLIDYLSSDQLLGLSENERFMVWSELTQLIVKHRKYAHCHWAFDANSLSRLILISEKYVPTVPTQFHRILFNDYESNLYEEVGNYDEQRKNLEERRKTAIKEIYSYGGEDAILEFAKSVEHPLFVGICSGLISESNIEARIIPDLLGTQEIAYSQFVKGYVWGTFRVHGWTWVDQLDMTDWTPTQISNLLVDLPFQYETWERVNKLLGDEEGLYWSNANVNPWDAKSHLEWAIDRLVYYNRPMSAINCLYKLLHETGTICSTQAFHVLQSVIQNHDISQSLDAYHIVEIIKALQEDASCDKNNLAQIEWQFLPILNRYYQAYPKQLENQLANDPGFYCQIIRTIFKSKKEEEIKEVQSEARSNIAQNAYRLLHNWKTPPGTDQYGSFHGDILTQWADEVKQEATDSGHLGIAYSVLGKVLAYTPSDPNGLWIHESAAKLLNQRDSKKMRDGLQCELINSRGVYTKSRGKEERQLAVKFNIMAEDVELKGFHRLAETLRQIASSYENDAIREEKEVPFEV